MKHILTKKFIGYAVAILLACALVAAAISGHVLSRFAGTEEYTYNQISVADFYFTVDILGDSVDEATSQKTINIYGGSDDQTIKINVRNYFDEYRITSSEVKYTIASDSNSIVVKNSDSSAEIGSSAEQTFSDSTTAMAAGGTANQSTTFSLYIPAFTAEQEVEVTIKSSAPFTKTLTLVFKLNVGGSTVNCEIDNSSTQYSELIIKSDVALTSGTDTVTITWENTGLQFDNTNSYFELDTTDTNNTTAKIKNTTPPTTIPAEGSISVKFFKTSSSVTYTATANLVYSTFYTLTITISTGD